MRGWRGERQGILLKLRKVEIVGFKSFCEKTQVTFSGTGLTCIVGPNGCGKSNIVDAISWVLGEQSTKSLRAERMADCIFSGTAKRPPLGMAEVIITLEDTELAEAGRFILTGQMAEAGEAGADAEAWAQAHPNLGRWLWAKRTGRRREADRTEEPAADTGIDAETGGQSPVAAIQTESNVSEITSEVGNEQDGAAGLRKSARPSRR